MKKIILIFFFVTSSYGIAQSEIDFTNKLISDLRTELGQNGVSDLFVLKIKTHGSKRLVEEYRSDPCDSDWPYFTIYAFWKERNRGFVRKIDNCGSFNSVVLQSNEALAYFEKNMEKIRASEVKYYQTSSEGILIKTHQPHIKFWYFMGDESFEKQFSVFNLTTTKNQPNLNYRFNNDLALVKLNNICEEIINDLNGNKVFSRI